MGIKVKRTVKAAIALTPLPRLLLRSRATRHLTILAYHRIGDMPGPDYPFDAELISATAEEFRRELQYVKQNLDLITVDQLADAVCGKGSLPERPALVTFDDGYADNAECALPVLQELGVPACFFISTGIIGTDTIPWWDQVACCFRFAEVRVIPSPFGGGDPPYVTEGAARDASRLRFIQCMRKVPWSQALEAVEYLRRASGVVPEDYATAPLFMDWDGVRRLHRAGMGIGGHTRTHPIIAHVEGEDALRSEIVGCYQDIRHQLGADPVAFAYPVGSEDAMSERADELIRTVGFQVSFSYLHGLASRTGSVVRIPRVHTEFREDYPAFMLALAMAPSHAGSP